MFLVPSSGAVPARSLRRLFAESKGGSGESATCEARCGQYPSVALLGGALPPVGLLLSGEVFMSEAANRSPDQRNPHYLCPSCGHKFEIPAAKPPCPKCGTRCYEVVNNTRPTYWPGTSAA